MTKSRVTEEQMVAMLLEVDRISVAEVARWNKVAEQRVDNWRQRFGVMAPGDIDPLRELGAERGRLKRMLADRELAIDTLNEMSR